MKTSIVILTYNKLEYTQQCIESIRTYTEQGTYEIIVVDNNSTDDTPNWLRQQSDLHVIYNNENLGFPKGCNQGMEVATGDQILLLNNDTIVAKNWLSNLVTCLYSDRSIGAVGSITNSCSYYQSIDTSYKNLSEMQAFAEKINISNPSRWEERLKLVGFCMLIKRSVLEQIGLLDERFTPGNYEDDDYSLRLRRAGYKLMLCRDSFIHHYGSISFGEDRERYGSVLHQNKKKFSDKWGFIPGKSEVIKHELIQLIQEPLNASFSVLEVASGRGGTLLKIKNTYSNAILYGIEEDVNARMDLQSITNHCGSLSEMLSSLPKHAFDYIILGELPGDSDASVGLLNMFREYLKPTGQLLADIYNVTYHRVIRDLSRGHFDQHRKNTYSFSEIEHMLGLAGFQEPEMTASVLENTPEEDAYVRHLCEVHGVQTERFYNIYKFQIKSKYRAGINSYGVSNVIEEIVSTNNTVPIVEQLLNYDKEEVVNAICSLSLNRVDLLNKIAVDLYTLNQYDYSLFLLQKAYTLEASNIDTLYNMASILDAAGEKESALQWLYHIPESEREVDIQEFIDKLDADVKINQVMNMELKFLLRRIENDLDQEHSLDQVLLLLDSDPEYLTLIIEVIENSIIHKDKLLNLLAVSCLRHESLSEFVIPLLQKSLETNPRNDDTLYNLGLLMYQLGECQGASIYLKKIKNKDEETIALINELDGVLVHEN